MRKLIFFCLCSLLFVGNIHAVNNRDTFIVWLANGQNPANVSSRGSVVMMNGNGEILQEITPVRATDAFVLSCTEQATSPNGRHSAFYVGGNTGGTLYIVTGTNTPVAIPNVSPFTCLGMGSFIWREDSNGFAYINYSNTQNIPHGQLVVASVNTPTTPSYTLDDVAAFHLSNNQLAVVEVVSDSVRVKTGTLNSPLTEVSRIYSDREGCPFRAGDIHRVTNNTLTVMLGQNCRGTNAWALYNVDIPARIANRVLAGGTGRNNAGTPVFVSQAASNLLIGSSSTDSVYVAFPDGLLGNFSAFIHSVDLRRIQPIDSPDHDFIVMPRMPLGNDSAIPALSRNGRYLVTVRQTADIISSLLLFDLNTHDAVTAIPVGTRGDYISATAFTPDCRNLYYLAGRTNGNENGLYRLPVNSSSTTEVTRGNFIGPLVIAPDNNQALLMTQTTGGVNNIPYLNLVAVDLRNGNITPIFEGAEFGADGLRTRNQFAMPLLWLPR
jgi:hypothetical protein